MGAFIVVVVQVVLAVLVSGLLLPAILFAVPATQNAGPVVMALVVAVMFILLRVAWPRAK